MFLAFVGWLAVAGCKRAPHAADVSPTASASASAAPSPSASAAGAPPAEARCRAEPAAHSVALGVVPAPSASAEEGDEDLPFSPEVGTGVAWKQGFAVGALQPSPKSTSALVVLVGLGPTPRRIDLGAVHGDVLPPLVGVGSESLVVAVPDGAPSGMLIRLARLDDPQGRAAIAWGAELPMGHDESDAVALDVGAKVAVLAWDDSEGRDSHAVVRAVTFSPLDPKKASSPAVLSGANEDAESPLVVVRPGGFWVAWISNGRKPPGRSEAHEPTHETEPVDLGPRWVTLVPLDENGKPTSLPIAVTPKEGHVMSFDVVASGSGGALVVWRDDATSPATAGGVVRLALVRPDGSVDPRPVADDEVGAARPTFLSTKAGAPDASVWLSLSTDAETTRLVALDAEGRARDILSAEPAIGTASPLGINGDRLLVVRPKGSGVSLDFLDCRPGPASDAPEGKGP